MAVVAEDGQVQLNKNVVNGSEPMLRLIGDLPPGTTVASGAAFGWGWLACSSIARRRGNKTATIAIARKLLTRAWHLLAETPATGTTTPPRRP